MLFDKLLPSNTGGVKNNDGSLLMIDVTHVNLKTDKISPSYNGIYYSLVSFW